MMRLTYGAFGTIAVEWSQILIILSVSSMIIGTLGAIIQSDIKRMMAYSSIAHMGYGLAGLATGTEQGAIGVIIYMTGYIFMGAGSFSMILLMRRDGQAATRIVDLQGLSGTHPMQALGFMIVMFSMAGIPPLAGFFGKWYVFFAAVDAGLVFLAIIGVVTSVASAFYYLRIVKIMYFEDADELLDEHVPLPNKFVMGLSVAVILMFFVGLGPLLEEAGIAAGAWLIRK